MRWLQLILYFTGTDDEDKAPLTSSKLDELGIIRLNCFRAERVGEEDWDDPSAVNADMFSDSALVHEKSKKGGTHPLK